MLKANYKPLRSFKPLYTGGKASIVASPDGVGLLLSTVDKDIHVMEVETGIVRTTIEGTADEVTCFAVKNDASLLVSATRSLLLNIVNVSDGTVLRSWKAHSAPVLTMAFDETSTLVATGSADSTIRIWDVDGGFATHFFKGHSGVISALSFFNGDGPNNVLLASASDDCTVRVWDLKSKSCIRILENHVSVVRGVCFSRDGRWLVTGGRDKIINVWDLSNGEIIKTIPTNESMEAVGLLPESSRKKLAKKLGLSSNTKIVYSGGEKGLIRLWDAESGDCIAEQDMETNSSHEITDVLLRENGDQLVAVTTDHNFLFYDTLNSLKRTNQIVGYNEEVVDVCFIGPSESSLAVASNSEKINIMDLDSSHCEVLHGHTGVVVCLDKSADGVWLVSGSKDRTALLWRCAGEANRFSLVGSCSGHNEAVGAVAFSKRSNGFVITGSQDRTIKVWDVSSLEKRLASERNPTEPHKVSSKFTFQAHEKDINSIAVSPNDKLFATGSQDKTAKIWSIADDGALVATLQGHRRGVWSVAFSPVDQVLATSSGDRTIRLWNARGDYSCLRTLEGHLNSVLKICFVSVGLQLVSSGSDGLVKLWNVKGGECVTTLVEEGHEDKVWALAVDKRDERMATGGADSTIVVWKDSTAEEKEEEDRSMHEKVEKEQDLQNFLFKKDYKNAILLAMELDKPMKLLSLFKDVDRARIHSTSVTGLSTVDQVIKDLDQAKLEQLLKYLRDWNTHSKHARIAQLLLSLILVNKPFAEFLQTTKRIKEILDSLIVYSERHYAHTDEMLQKSYLVAYTVDRMGDMIGGDGEI